jgi:3-oxoacyl-[acyl-carrier protein] reductase
MKNAFILGGHGDIGKTIVSYFKEMGFQVTSPGSKELDLTRKDEIAAYFNRNDVQADVLINSAGLNNPKAFEELSYDDILMALHVNFIGFFDVIQRLTPMMKKQKSGYVLGISSIYGFMSRKGRLPYSSAKHAHEGMVKTLALELGPHNVLINSLSPGFVDTDMTRRNNDDATIQSFIDNVPLGRLASTEDIAKVAYFLCSGENRYITGQNIVVDGGYSIGGFQK